MLFFFFLLKHFPIIFIFFFGNMIYWETKKNMMSEASLYSRYRNVTMSLTVSCIYGICNTFTYIFVFLTFWFYSLAFIDVAILVFFILKECVRQRDLKCLFMTTAILWMIKGKRIKEIRKVSCVTS